MGKPTTSIDAAARLAENIAIYSKNNQSMIRHLGQNGQSPEMLVISCIDSRSNPVVLSNAVPGEIFYHTNIAAIVPPYEEKAVGYHGTSSVIEFTVNTMKVKKIIVLGHGDCGGVKALLSNDPANPESIPYEFINSWMGIAAKARQEVLAAPKLTEPEKQHLCEEKTVLVSLANLLTFPFVKEKVASGELSLEGWHYDLKTAKLTIYNKASGLFESAKSPEEAVVI